jgi:hypothetical protein
MLTTMRPFSPQLLNDARLLAISQFAPIPRSGWDTVAAVVIAFRNQE